MSKNRWFIHSLHCALVSIKFQCKIDFFLLADRETIHHFEIKSIEGTFSIRRNVRCIRNFRFNTCANDLRCFHCYRRISCANTKKTVFIFLFENRSIFCSSMEIRWKLVAAFFSHFLRVLHSLIDSIMNYINWEDLVLALVLLHWHAP